MNHVKNEVPEGPSPFFPFLLEPCLSETEEIVVDHLWFVKMDKIGERGFLTYTQA